MIDTQHGHVGELLFKTATALAEAGATAETVLTDHLSEVPTHLAGELRRAVPLPDSATGWRVVRGLLAGFGDPGPTPPHWKDAPAERTHALDIALILVAESLGSVFGWAGQQGGRLLHNIVPAKGYEDQQVGASSSTPLYWHTEDAFHPGRAGLLILACVRNPDDLGSRVAGIRQAGLTGRQVELLHEAHLTIMPDDSYPGQWQDDLEGKLHPMATLWEAEDGTCLRYDPSYTRMLTADDEFRAAYDALEQALEECSQTMPIQAGDIALIDNDVAVHGRPAFQPRYDGTDRWLKRVLVDLSRPRSEAELIEVGFGQERVEPRRMVR